MDRIIPASLDGDELWRRNGEYVDADSYDKAVERVARLEHEQRETLRAVLHHFGPDGAKLVTDHVLETQK